MVKIFNKHHHDVSWRYIIMLIWNPVSGIRKLRICYTETRIQNTGFRIQNTGFPHSEYGMSVFRIRISVFRIRVSVFWILRIRNSVFEYEVYGFSYSEYGSLYSSVFLIILYSSRIHRIQSKRYGSRILSIQVLFAQWLITQHFRNLYNLSLLDLY